MSYTELGAGMTAHRRNTQSSALTMVDQMMEDMEARCMARIDALFAGLKLPSPPAPNVSVAAPNVEVGAAQVTVEAPEINATIPGLAELAVAQKTTNDLLRQVLVELAKPTVRTVERGAQDLITRVTESR